MKPIELVALLVAYVLAAQVAHAQSPAQIEAIRRQEWADYQQKLAVYQQQLVIYQQQMAAYNAQRSRSSSTGSATSASSLIRLHGNIAACSARLPVQVQYVINAANHLQESPYARGRGHLRIEDSAYDCSSSTSYALIKAGLLKSPLTSLGFANYGLPGEGRFITLWVKPGDHVFMTICGLRFDTSGGKVGEGSRWRTHGRSYAGFFPRHPYGL